MKSVMGRPRKEGYDYVALSTTFTSDERFQSIEKSYGIYSYILIEIILILGREPENFLDISDIKVFKDLMLRFSISEDIFISLINSAVEAGILTCEDNMLRYPELQNGYRSIRTIRRRISRRENNDNLRQNCYVSNGKISLPEDLQLSFDIDGKSHKILLSREKDIYVTKNVSCDIKEKRTKKENININNNYNIYSSSEKNSTGVHTHARGSYGLPYEKRKNNDFKVFSFSKKQKCLSGFEKPSLRQVEEKVRSGNLSVDAKEFYDYYDKRGWRDRKNNPIRFWDTLLDVWNKNMDAVSSQKSFITRALESDSGERMMVVRKEELSRPCKENLWHNFTSPDRFNDPEYREYMYIDDNNTPSYAIGAPF